MGGGGCLHIVFFNPHVEVLSPKKAGPKKAFSNDLTQKIKTHNVESCL